MTTGYTRPTLSELRSQALAYFRAQGFDSGLKKSVIVVVSYVLALLAYGIYGFLDFLILQVFPDTATGDYLARWCGWYGKPRIAATYAAGSLIFTGTAATVIAAGTVATYAATSIGYSLDADATIGSDGTVTAAVTALTAGADGNLYAGAILTLATAISGVDGTATVATAGISGGTDAETDTAWQTRLKARVQNPPQGGNADDYAAWAKDSSSEVTRVWVYPQNRGMGTVDVAFVMDDRAIIIPLAADVTMVQTTIDAKRPVTDDCVVFAPTGLALTLTLTGLVPNTTSTQAAVTTAWSDFLKTYANPGGTLSFDSQICPAIAAATGVTGFVISKIGGVAAADVTAPSGVLFTPGAITFP